VGTVWDVKASSLLCLKPSLVTQLGTRAYQQRLLHHTVLVRNFELYTIALGCGSSDIDCNGCCPQVEAFEAYANREFSTVLQKLSDILAADPSNPRWYEMRAQVGGGIGQQTHTAPTACLSEQQCHRLS
jgi:hypothetical protein